MLTVTVPRLHCDLRWPGWSNGPPTDAQQAIFRQIVEHAGSVTSLLEAQFASAGARPHSTVRSALTSTSGMGREPPSSGLFVLGASGFPDFLFR
jgi:hypothetical protein